MQEPKQPKEHYFETKGCQDLDLMTLPARKSFNWEIVSKTHFAKLLEGRVRLSPLEFKGKMPSEFSGKRVAALGPDCAMLLTSSNIVLHRYLYQIQWH